jgi:hypothetical protein
VTEARSLVKMTCSEVREKLGGGDRGTVTGQDDLLGGERKIVDKSIIIRKGRAESEYGLKLNLKSNS